MAQREVVRPRLWRSWGVWAPIAVAAVSLWRLIGTESVLAVDIGLILVSAAVFVATVLGGVEVGPEGVRSRRITRKRRSARWDEIVAFVGDTKEPVSARLTDGSDLRLFDYAGDGERVAHLLEDARQRYQSDTPA